MYLMVHNEGEREREGFRTRQSVLVGFAGTGISLCSANCVKIMEEESTALAGKPKIIESAQCAIIIHL